MIPVPGIERFFVLVYPGLEVPDLSTGVVYKFEPVQLVTHMFMHGDERHLLFNMLGLFFLVLWLNPHWEQKVFILYILSGFFATLLHFIFNPGIVVGASGAVYGTLAAFATMFPNIELMMMFIPVPIKAKYMALGLIAIGLYMGFSQSNDQIAHLAHVGGALMGFILVRYWKMENLR